MELEWTVQEKRHNRFSEMCTHQPMVTGLLAWLKKTNVVSELNCSYIIDPVNVDGFSMLVQKYLQQCKVKE